MPNEVDVIGQVAAGAAAVDGAAKAAQAKEPGKSIFKSKIFWLNVAAFGAHFLGYLPAHGPEAIAVANILLRFVTSQPIVL